MEEGILEVVATRAEVAVMAASKVAVTRAEALVAASGNRCPS